MLSEAEWHHRFSQQALWTQELRQHFFNQRKISPDFKILEVGCGTGAICAELAQMTTAKIYGVDLLHRRTAIAHNNVPLAFCTCADALVLPFPENSFDMVVCHYFLLWVSHPGRALNEMKRVARQNGFLVAFAEPDYAARIDYPNPLDELGRRQTAALAKQGADVQIGRKLKSLFSKTGLDNITTGILGGCWAAEPNLSMLDSEWQAIRADLSDSASPTELNTFQQLDSLAWQNGSRLLFVPTCYAWGKVIK